MYKYLYYLSENDRKANLEWGQFIQAMQLLYQKSVNQSTGNRYRDIDLIYVTYHKINKIIRRTSRSYDNINTKGKGGFLEMSEKTTRDKIFDTALNLFEKYGYHKVSVDQIVKESGTSKGGFYHNFKSKDELLFTIHDQFINYVLEKAQEAYNKWETPVERLCAIVKSFVKMIDLYKSHVTVFYQESHYLSPAYFPAIEEKRDRYKEMLFKVIEDGKKTGLFRKEISVPIVAMAIFGMVNWIYKWYQRDGLYSIEQIADSYTDMILSSILVEEAKENPQFSNLLLKK